MGEGLFCRRSLRCGSLRYTKLCIRLSVLTLSVRFTIQGIVIVLLFQCMSALLDPVHHTAKGFKWGLVAHTVAMFLTATIGVVTSRNIFSSSFIDRREFHGVEGYPSGPTGYQNFANLNEGFVIKVVRLMFPLNQWLADGLLVSSASDSVAQVPNVGHYFSCIVVTLFIQ
jgi:hypothetical protein